MSHLVYFIGVYVAQARRPVNDLSQPVLELFQKYSWPGNVRQLENIIGRAVYKGRTELIRLEDLPLNFAQETAGAPMTLGNYGPLMQENSRQYSRRLVLAALTESRGNRVKAAKLLELSRDQLYRLEKMHGLDDEAADERRQQDQTDDDSNWML